MKDTFRHIIILASFFVACNSPNDKSNESIKNLSIAKNTADKKRDIYELLKADNRPKDILLQIELYDSSKLSHIKNQFYKSISGHLYERTWSQRQIDGIDTLVWIEYFNGHLIQEIDPMTFELLNGWFAKDKYHVYYYRPTSGGMLSVKLANADPKTFEILNDQYEYAIDKSNVFRGTELLIGLNPKALKIIKNKEGQISKIISGSKTYKAD